MSQHYWGTQGLLIIRGNQTMKIFRIILCIVMVFIAGICLQALAQEKTLKKQQKTAKKNLAKPEIAFRQSFDEFWKEFREAVITENKEKVADLTRFPLEISGEFDFVPHRFVRRPQFIKLEFYQTFIKPYPEAELGQIENVKASPVLSDFEEEIKEGSVSFYNLEFRQVQGKWKLVNVYQAL